MGVLTGLLVGGTWAAMSVPHDIRTTLFPDFRYYLEGFWREGILLTLAAMIGNFVYTRFLPKTDHEPGRFM